MGYILMLGTLDHIIPWNNNTLQGTGALLCI